MEQHILSAVIALPVLGSLVVLLVSSRSGRSAQNLATAFSLITFVLSAALLLNYDAMEPGMQFSERIEWIRSFGIFYDIGLDGLSLPLVLLTSLVFFLCCLAPTELKAGAKGYFSLFLWLESALLGFFCAKDLFLFFVFWTMSILPAYFIVSIWGGADRERAATRFFLYQLVGCALFLLGMFAVYYYSEPHSFSLADLGGGKFSSVVVELASQSFRFDRLIFVLFLFGVAIRIPMFPFHGWFIHFQKEAPTSLTVVMASVFIKAGAYALIRLNYSLFPDAALWIADFMVAVGVLNVLYGAVCALAQQDVRKLVSYGTISHVGFIVFGLSVFSRASFHGAILQMIAHGIYAALLFFLVGALGSRSRHFEIMRGDGSMGFGGLASRAPILTVFFTVALFASLGIPGLGVFSSELLIMLGSFQAHRTFTVVALCGVLFTAAYLIRMYRRIFLGAAPASSASSEFSDLGIRERLGFAPLALLCFFIGINPGPLLRLSTAAVGQLLAVLGGKA
ncbi:MAG: NADH-quinone oxidoreductase subunit M [Deltaproteobacteria bacterium]|nr:NADH-quinone oxidoreductase subunit M [Deltaproteobacteria bacterium]